MSCCQCLKLIWEDGQRVDPKAKFYKSELVLIGFCGDCDSKGAFETHPAKHLVEPIPEDRVVLEEVMGS